MPQYLSPGVYIEEKEAGSRPLEGVNTAVAAFVGMATQGPFNTPTLITNWTQFTQTFGDFAEGSYLAHAVYGYFLNGGGTTYVIRIGQNGAKAEPAAKAELMSSADGKLGTYRVVALQEGVAGNDITVEVQEATEKADDTFKLVIRKPPAQEEVFDNLTSKRGRQHAVTVVNAQSQLIRLEEIATGNAVEKRPASATSALAGG